MKVDLDTIIDELTQGDRALVRIKGAWGGAKLPKDRNSDIVVTISVTNTKENQHAIADMQQGDNFNLIGYYSDEQMELSDEAPRAEEDPDQQEFRDPDDQDEEEDIEEEETDDDQ